MALNTVPIAPYWERPERPDNNNRAFRRKGQGKGKGKGASGRKGKGKGQNAALHIVTKEVLQLKTAVNKLILKSKKPEEERAQERELRETDRKKKNEEVVQMQSREYNHPDLTFTGVFARKTKTYGWIILDHFFKLPPDLMQAVMTMLTDKQKRLFENSKEDKLFNSLVVFMHSFELTDKKCRTRPGDRLEFKLYTDSVGVGAYEIRIIERAGDR